MFLATAVSPGASPTPAATAGSSPLPVLDAVIVLALLVALVIGYQKGIITPLMIYFFLSGLITLDKAFTPILNSAKLTQAQVTTLNKVIQSNPLAVALIDPNDLKKLQDQAKKGQQASLDSVTELNNLKSFYEDFI